MSDQDGRAQGQDLRSYYETHGYVIVRGLVPERLLDPVLAAYLRDIKPARRKFFRQSTGVYDLNAYNEGGHVTQSFLDVHHYKRFPDFRRAALDVYFSDEVLGALTKVTGHRSHNLMQSMLFDANVSSPPHQDNWYVDTVPAGQVLGAWFALEDIREEAGRFFVMPGTQNVAFHREGLSHSQWLVEVRRYRDAHTGNVVAPEMKKGDVLFWNSGTIHGALPTKDRRVSRRSLTAHYMPTGLTYGNLFGPKPWVKYEQHGGHQYFANQPEHTIKAELVTRLKMAMYDSPRLLKLARRFQRRSLAEV
jgi:phytanoyl-CoA hydroxylase